MKGNAKSKGKAGGRILGSTLWTDIVLALLVLGIIAFLL